jgi:hypothetical protein
MGDMTFVFETERLRVFAASVTPWEGSEPSSVYLAFLRSGGAPQTIAHAVVSDHRGRPTTALFPLYCNLLEVSAMFRRQKYGKELFLAIEQHLGAQMIAIPATDEGKAFLAALGRPSDPLAPHLVPIQRFLDYAAGQARIQGKQDAVEILVALQGVANDTSRPAHDRIRALHQVTEAIGNLLPAGGFDVSK